METLAEKVERKMEAVHTTEERAPEANPFSLEAIRAPQDFSGGVSVVRKITRIQVRKPNRHEFVRVRPGEDWTLEILTIQDKRDRTLYAVAPALLGDPLVQAEAQRNQIYVAINRQNTCFLWPVPLPGQDGKWNAWHQTLSEAAQAATSHWVKVMSNRDAGAYEFDQAMGSLGEPDWPELSLEELLRLGLKETFIDSVEHPFLRAIRGQV